MQARTLSRYARWQAAALVAVALTLLITACGPSTANSAPSSPRIATTRSAFTYVAIGASDAFGIGTDDPDMDNWPIALATQLGPGVHLVNLGIPGETVAEAHQTELPIALDAHPELVTVWLGVNDIVQNVSVADYTTQLTALLSSLRQHTQARIFVGNIPDLTLLPFFSGYDHARLAATIAQWNSAISQAVTTSGASLIDLYSTWNELAQHPEYIAGDGFHPSTAGAWRLAQVFASWISPSLPALRAAGGA
jgi:lysophospholipase L1-like esterase